MLTKAHESGLHLGGVQESINLPGTLSSEVYFRHIAGATSRAGRKHELWLSHALPYATVDDAKVYMQRKDVTLIADGCGVAVFRLVTQYLTLVLVAVQTNGDWKLEHESRY